MGGNGGGRWVQIYVYRQCRIGLPLFFLPIHVHLGGFEGEWGVYCCTCKGRAVLHMEMEVTGHHELGRMLR